MLTAGPSLALRAGSEIRPRLDCISPSSGCVPWNSDVDHLIDGLVSPDLVNDSGNDYEPTMLDFLQSHPLP